jgi:FkbM family methyltransferase
MNVRSPLKKLYMALPFKQQAFTLLRRFWTPPPSIYRYLYFRGVFSVRVRDSAFLIRHHGFSIETDVFWSGLTGSWERHSMEIWIRLAERSGVILDVGANTGIYSLVAKTVNRSARVYAFEPVRRIYEKLAENVRLNAFDVDCRPVALSDRDGEDVLFDLPYEHVYAVSIGNNIHGDSPDVIRTTVPTQTLRAFVDTERLARIDLLKIDVESHEPEVLAGFGSYLAAMRPAMLIEIWHNEEHGDLRIGSRVEAAVSGCGYVYYRIDEVSGASREAHISPAGSGYSNYLICTPEQAAAIGLS